MDASATREIMWNIPIYMKICMYTMTIISLIIMITGIYSKLKIATGPHGLGSIKTILPSSLNWKSFFKTILLQGKVRRDPQVGIFHSLIFYGFVVLWIATDIVAIHYDTPFKIFKGPLYIIISFLADIGGLTLLMGIFLAYQRRYQKKPSYLSSTNPYQELFMYSMLVLLVVLGFALEGLRILGTGMPAGEKFYSPIGYFLAVLFGNLNISDSGLATTYRLLWFFSHG